MCRLVGYLGPQIVLSQVLLKPINSLVSQSLRARESSVPTNGDGFGVAWYAPEIRREPGLFTSISPAWSNQNLIHLSEVIQSPAFFAHVRAASEGGVSMTNCHPFIHNEWLFMHNGGIDGFMRIKRHLRHLLDDDIYNWIKGETDSEHFFALFLQLAKGRDLSQLDVVAGILEATVQHVLALLHRFNPTGAMYLNVVLSNGRQLVASRYCSDSTIVPESMHYGLGHRLATHSDDKPHARLLQVHGDKQCVLVASEKLTDTDSEWHDVLPNQLLMVDQSMQVHTRMMRLQ